MPETRALAVGEIMKTPSDDFQPEDMLDKDMLNPYGIRGRHTINFCFVYYETVETSMNEC